MTPTEQQARAREIQRALVAGETVECPVCEWNISLTNFEGIWQASCTMPGYGHMASDEPDPCGFQGPALSDRDRAAHCAAACIVAMEGEREQEREDG